MHISVKSKNTRLHLPCFKSLELSLLESLISIFATPAGVQTSTGNLNFTLVGSLIAYRTGKRVALVKKSHKVKMPSQKIS